VDEEYGPETYGDRIADVYDELYGEVPFSGDPSATVTFLRSVAGTGPVLELGIGTGRIALPLHAAGVEVHGIDASEKMVERLRAKPGGAEISVTIGDFARFTLRSRFGLVYVVFNTFFGLLSQDDQVSCFQAVAEHLAQDGTFVIEAFIPDPTRFDRGQRVSAVDVDPDEIQLEVSRLDALTQTIRSHRVVIREDGVQLYPIQIRYTPPAELDLMARLAGLRLRERWANWDRTPLQPSSTKHISVWEPAR
jgi:Methyltransferase domain